MFACLYVPNFAAEAVMRSDSAAWREQPVAILDGTPPLVRVFAVNERAREAGVDIGMTKLQAEALPGIVLRQRSLIQEVIAHHAFADCCCAVSPRIEEVADDTILLDISGLERIFGPPAEIARELARRVAEVGIQANIATAVNADAAIHAARGFSGVTAIAPGEEAERLGPLPIEVLVASFAVQSTEYYRIESLSHRAIEPLKNAANGQPVFNDSMSQWPNGSIANDQRPKTNDRKQRQQRRAREQYAQELLDTFDRWGVRTFRALAMLPPVAVAERLGQDGITLQKLARGEGLRALSPTEPPLKFEEALELEYPVDNLEPLAFILNRLLEQLCARLEARSLATNELRLTLELEQGVDSTEYRVPSEEVSSFKFQVPSCHSERSEESAVGNIESLSHRVIEPLKGGLTGQPVFNGPMTQWPNDSIPNDSANDQQPTSNDCFRRTLHLPTPMRNARVFLKLLQLDLAANPPSAPITKIFLAAEPVRPQVAQHGLFRPLEPQPEKLELMLARISGIVGAGRVGSPELLDTHRPDAFRMRRFSATQEAKNSPRRRGDTEKNRMIGSAEHRNNISRTGRSVSATLNASADDPMFRSSDVQIFRFFRPPRIASVKLRDGMPVRVSCAGEQGPRGDVAWAAGPWRSSGDWWQDMQKEGSSATGPWSREEWDVLINGAVYRLVRVGGEAEWQVDGSYD